MSTPSQPGREHLLYFEDFVAGETVEYGPRTITREEIIAYAAEFDPQPFHLDDAAGRASMLGELSGSGWHSCCIVMRMLCDGFLLRTASMGAPGVEEVRWLAPVRPGDELTLSRTLLDARVSRSRPQAGFLTFLMELRNQAGTIVLSMKSPLMVERRAHLAEAVR